MNLFLYSWEAVDILILKNIGIIVKRAFLNADFNILNAAALSEFYVSALRSKHAKM